MPKYLPSPILLRKLLRYDPDSGKLFWRERSVGMFSDGKYSRDRKCRMWNGHFAGREAFTAHCQGYLHGRIFGQTYGAHRVIWAFANGEWASDQIDHVNGVRDDNRIVNLRAVSRATNSKNRRMYATNTSAVMGVMWCKRDKKWVARINVKRKRIYLGYFTNKSDATTARAAAEVKYDYHANHGRS